MIPPLHTTGEAQNVQTDIATHTNGSLRVWSCAPRSITDLNIGCRFGGVQANLVAEAHAAGGGAGGGIRAWPAGGGTRAGPRAAEPARYPCRRLCIPARWGG